MALRLDEGDLEVSHPPALTPGEPGYTMRALKKRLVGAEAPGMALENLSEALDSGLLVNDLEAAACLRRHASAA